MRKHRWLAALSTMAIGFVLWGCNLQLAAGADGLAATQVVQTVVALQTDLARAQTASASVPAIEEASAAPATEPSATLAPVPTGANPVVSNTALCWTGPGSAYRVVSSVKVGTVVTVLGVGSQVGWLVIVNPMYGDRCWIEVKNLRLDPYFNTAGMQIFNPPPTPGPKVTPIPTPT